MTNSWTQTHRTAYIKRAGGLLLALVAATQLSACFPLIVAGASAGAVSAEDRRPTSVQWNDEQIDRRVSGAISARFGSLTHVNVYSYNHSVLLTGEVPDDAAKATIEKLAHDTQDVKQVYNELAVMLPSSLAARASDSALTTRIKAKLLNVQGTSPVNVKITTERNNVFLMGQVSHAEGKLAADAASEVPGVEKVTVYFDYMD